MGGLGVQDLEESAQLAYSAPKEGMAKFISAIKGEEEF